MTRDLKQQEKIGGRELRKGMTRDLLQLKISGILQQSKDMMIDLLQLRISGKLQPIKLQQQKKQTGKLNLVQRKMTGLKNMKDKQQVMMRS